MRYIARDRNSCKPPALVRKPFQCFARTCTYYFFMEHIRADFKNSSNNNINYCSGKGAECIKRTEPFLLVILPTSTVCLTLVIYR